MPCNRRRLAVVSLCSALAVPFAPGTSLTASGPVISAPLVSGLAGPLQPSVARDGTVFVAQNFTGTLTKLGAGGATITVAQAPDGTRRVRSTASTPATALSRRSPPASGPPPTSR